MTAAIALLLIAVLLVALGRRHRVEPAAPHLVGAGFICLLLAILVFATGPAAADEPAGPPPAEAPAQVYTIIKLEVLQQAAALIEAQRVEILRLRGHLKQATQPKECI